MDPDSVKALIAQLVVEAAVTELYVLCTDSDNKLWVKDNGRDVLILREYISRFSPSFTINISTFEASRDTRAYHMMDYNELATILIQGNRSALFPFVIANEETVKVFPFFDPSEGSFNLVTYIKSLARLTTAGVAKRKVNTLRACQQVRERALLLVEVTYEREEVEHGRESNCHRFASGCLIEEDLNNGGSRSEQGRDVLVQHKYRQAFPWWNNNSSWTTEASRASALVKMHHSDLADMLAEEDWSFDFPHIVAKEETIRVLSPGKSDGTLPLAILPPMATPSPSRGGSVITLVLQMLVDGNQPLQEKRQQSIKSITFAINQTLERIKEALEKPRPPSPSR
nr:homeobox domain-containing protein/START domain-containing protein [Tanacetum cinerariifolium]